VGKPIKLVVCEKELPDSDESLLPYLYENAIIHVVEPGK
jgi:hypothetical protein